MNRTKEKSIQNINKDSPLERIQLKLVRRHYKSNDQTKINALPFDVECVKNGNNITVQPINTFILFHFLLIDLKSSLLF